VAQAILERARARTEVLAAQGIVPVLAILSCGTDLAAEAYLAGLASAAKRTGVRLSPVALPQGTTQEAAQEALLALGRDHDVHGILLVHPLPPDWDEGKLTACLPPEKDVEGIHPRNLGRLLAGGAAAADLPRLLREGPLPATPRAVMELLAFYEVELAGREVVVVGGGRVGLPLFVLLLREALSTVTVCDRNTRDLAEVSRRADVLCVAVGQPGLVRGHMVKPGGVVVDIGVHRLGNGLVGDVNFEEAAGVARAITPVPGGVGPVTAAVVVEQTVRAAARLVKEGTG